MRITDLSQSKQRKVIKIYLDAFKRSDVPCPKCRSNCCVRCESAQGYLASWNKSDAKNCELIAATKEKYGFVDTGPYDTKKATDKGLGLIDHGFFRAGKGCVIPYKERSPTCVGFTCMDMTTQQQHAGRQIYSTLINQ